MSDAAVALRSEYEAAVKPVVLQDAVRGNELFLEWQKRLLLLREAGLIDCKMKLMSDTDATVPGVVAIMNNLLRLREEGKTQPLSLVP